MARSVDLFIDSELELDCLAEQLGRRTGCKFAPDLREGRYVLSEGQVVAHLGEHPYQDDGELPLSRYRYALSARVAGDLRPQDSPEAMLLRHMSQQLQGLPGWRTLLVLDLQYRDHPEPPTSTLEHPSNGPAGEAAARPSGAGRAGSGEDLPQ